MLINGEKKYGCECTDIATALTLKTYLLMRGYLASVLGTSVITTNVIQQLQL